MKKIVSALITAIMLFTLFACSSGEKDFDALRERVELAGYDVSDAYVDASFTDVVKAFSVKVNFDANTVASIPIILTKSEAAAKKNCELFGANSIKLPIQNGCIFSYPGRDYPEHVLNLITAIVNGSEIPVNVNAE